MESRKGSHLSYVCPHCHRYLLENYIWWVSIRQGDSSKKKKKQCIWWCAAYGGQYDWRNPNGVLGLQDSIRAHTPPTGACENFMCSLRFLAKSAIGSLVQVLVEGLQEQSR